MQRMNSVAVLGGGAAGIMAGITAARCGSRVILIEKNHRIGKKLLMTGNGRCNLTNMEIKAERYNSAFVRAALSSFSPYDTVSFFKELGLLTHLEEEGRVYPLSNQAAALLEVLLLEIKRRNIEVICDFDITGIEKTEKGFEIKSKDRKSVSADKIVVALGGKAAPATGSDGRGYELLKSMGHTVKTPQKALVQLKTDKSIKGVRADAEVTLNGKSERGEVQFTGYGLSGIPILNLSRYAKEGDVLALDLVPDYDGDTLFRYLKERPGQSMETYLVGILNKPLGQMLLKECGIGKLSRDSGSLTDAEIKNIAEKLKCWQFTVTGKMGWDNAQVTMGGIALSEINPETMESEIVEGCYIAGEIADVDAECGGFNLQWAWASGFLAGKNAAKRRIGDEIPT